jgi:hypothetical protein
MANKKIKWGILALAAVFGFLLAGCDGSLFTPDENGNKPLDTTKIYAFYNESSYTVTLWDGNGGSAQLAPDGWGKASFNNEISISDVVYNPSNYVRVTKSGSTSFTFYDKD